MGLFGGGYESSGTGIAKDAPKKKPFFRYWELTFRKFWKLININILMMATILPLILMIPVIYYLTNVSRELTLFILGALLLLFVVSFGPSIAGFTKIFRNYSLEKPTFIWDTFIKTFRSCFKQAFVMGLLDLVVIASVASGLYVYPQLLQKESSMLYYFLFIGGMSIGIAVLLMSFYAYLMIVSTDLSMVNILKNSFALSCVALKKNLITLGITIGVVLVFALLTIVFPLFMVPVLVFLPIAFIGFMIVFNCYPVVQKYVINPYYAQRGEVSPELSYTQTAGENVFEDRGGKEKPVEPKKTKKKSKGKVIS